MATYSNGITTKENILHSARALFFQQGYRATTTRQIVKCSNVNLGLIKYHFNSKADMALAIYAEIGQTITDWAAALRPARTPAEQLMLSSTAEILLTFTSPEFGRFFNELYAEPKVLSLFMENLNSMIPSTFIARRREINREHTLFIELCLLGAKTNIIRYVSPALNDAGQALEADDFLTDHMRLHAELLNVPDPDETVERCLALLRSYDFRLRADMTLEICGK